MIPSIASEWPTMYLVAAWMTMSTPWRSGFWNSGVAQVLSSTTSAPAAWAAAAMAGTSWTSKVGDAGADQRVVVGGGDAEAAEQPVAQGADRSIDAVAHQDVIAAVEEGHQRDVDGGQARGQCESLLAALERRDRFLEGEGRGRA